MPILDGPLMHGSRSGVLERIQLALSEFSPAEKMVAKQILQDPAHAVALSINEFAHHCNVSQPTVSRFCRTLGLPGYAALRLTITNDLALHPPPSGGIQGEEAASLDFSQLAAKIEAMPEINAAAHTLRWATRVEIWPTADLTHIGMVLADRLTALSIPAACAPRSGYWNIRASGFPYGTGTVVLLLTHGELGEAEQAAVATARLRNSLVLHCTTNMDSISSITADGLLLLPHILPLELVEFAFVEVLVNMVRTTRNLSIPPGLASPWHAWPHVKRVFLPNKNDVPIPALLLTCEEPPLPRPLILYFGGLLQAKEEALPGAGDHHLCHSLIAALLNTGCHVLSVDARAHGERKRSWENSESLLLESFSGKGEDVLKGALHDAPALVDGALALGVTSNPPLLGLLGLAWGAHQALLSFAGDPRISCMVGVMPICYTPQLREFAHLASAPRILNGDPGPWLGPRIAPRPLLLIVGEADIWADPAHARQFLDEVRPSYNALNVDDHLQAVFIPQLEHVEHPQQITATLNWIEQFLIKKHSLETQTLSL